MPPQAAALLLQAAVDALREDDLAGAEAALAQVLATEPEQIDALHFQGIVRHRQGNTQAALGLMRRALALQPSHAGLRLNLGNVHYESGQTLAAADAYRALIDSEPGSAKPGATWALPCTAWVTWRRPATPGSRRCTLTTAMPKPGMGCRAR